MLALLLTLGLPWPVLFGDPGWTGASSSATDVVIVVLDDLAERDIQDACTPNLDVFPGIYYRRTYAFPTCSPARYAMLYGRLPHRIGLGVQISKTSTLRPTPDGDSLADVFGCHGFETFMIGKWHLSLESLGVDSEDPRIHGFDHFWAGTPRNLEGQSYFDWQRFDDGIESRSTTYSSTAIVDAAITAYMRPGPKLLWVATHAAHTPIHVPPSNLYCPGQPLLTARNRYLAMISAVDHELGRLFEVIDFQKTIVVVVGDNGTPNNVMNGNRGKGSPYERSVHVPMWIHAPSLGTATRDDLASLVDVPATVCSLVGIGAEWEDSLDVSSRGRRMAYSSQFRPNGSGPYSTDDRLAVLADPYYKLIRRDGVEELYDLGTDPNEKVPLNLADPTLTGVLAQLRNFMSSVEDPPGPGTKTWLGSPR